MNTEYSNVQKMVIHWELQQHLLVAVDVGGRLQVPLRHLHAVDVKLLAAASHNVQVRGGGQHRAHRRGLRGPRQRVQADHDVHLKFK